MKQVTAVQGDHSIKVLIDDDVFAVYWYGANRRKPFFLPVTGPGGYELLTQAVESDPPNSDTRKVIVASESVQLESKTGEVSRVGYPDVLTINRVEGNQLWVDGRDAWIHRHDIVPFASTVTRLINDRPVSGKPIRDPDYYDHGIHKGIWCALDDVNGIRFWAEQGRIASRSVEILQQAGGRIVFRATNHWQSKEQEPILIETTLITIDANRLLVYDTTLSAGKMPVTIGDTKEGLFAIRLPNSMRELQSGGPVTNADGVQGTSNLWGKPSPWVDYVGSVLGHQFGVMLMDSAQNPWKSRHHVRDYGLFALNPFGSGSYTKGTDDEQPEHTRTLEPGESLSFRFGLWVHNGLASMEELRSIYAGFSGMK